MAGVPASLTNATETPCRRRSMMLDAEMLQQYARVARVLRRNQGNSLQYFARAHGQIAQIADRSRNHIQAPSRLIDHWQPL
jgi:hypothetical protein